jgi:phage shock protein E
MRVRTNPNVLASERHWVWGASGAIWVGGLLLLIVLVTVAWVSTGIEASDGGVDAVEEGWMSRIDPERAADLVGKGKVTVIDIRTPAEFSRGHLAGATNIDFMARDFADRVSLLDPGKTYLLHCATGRRSTQSLAIFKKLNFRSVLHMDGGIKAWKSEGQPVLE